jgi:hypothetical protein
MKDLKEVLVLLFSLSAAVVNAKANDGKIDIQDLPLLLGPMMNLPAAAEGISNVLPQWKNASDDERAELINYIKEQFDIADDAAEKKIEAGLKMLVEAGALFA